MIIKAIFDLISGVINLIPFELPQVPAKLQTVLDQIFNGLDTGFQYIGLFIDLPFWISCAVAVTIIMNIKKIWNFFIFLLNLIPSVNISYWK